MNILEAGCQWFGNNIRLVCPKDDTGTDQERRSYLAWVRVFLHILLICVVSLSIKLSLHFVCVSKTPREPNRRPTTLFKCLSELIWQRDILMKEVAVAVVAEKLVTTIACSGGVHRN